MSVTIKTNLGCNISCIYCNQEGFHNTTPPKLTYDIDEILKTLDIIDYSDGRNNGKDFGGDLCLHGGEPTMMRVKDMRLLLEKIREKHPDRHMSIQTNAYALLDEMILLFKEFGVSIGVSIDGPQELNNSRGFYDACGNRKDKFSDVYTKKVEENVQKMLDTGLPVGFICVLNKYNSSTKELRDRLKQWLLDWFSKGVNSARLNLAFMDNEISKAKIELTADEAAEAHVDYTEWALDHPEACLLPARTFVDNLLGLTLEECRFSSCDPYRTGGENVIMPDGGRGNCWRLVGKIGGGNFWTRDEASTDVRQHILYSVPMSEGGCGGCRYFKVCNGGCPAEAADGDWRNKTRFCKAYYDTYAVVERRLKSLIPNVHLVSDFREDELSHQDAQDRSSGNWSRVAFESTLHQYTQKPSAFMLAAKKQKDKTRPTLKLIDIDPSRLAGKDATSGILTYRNDFMNVIEPELRKYFDFTIYDRADYVFSLYRLSTEKERNEALRTIYVSHANYDFDNWLKTHGEKWVFNRQIILAHTMKIKEKIESLGGTSVFFPMSIDLSALPSTSKKNGKWIYFGNVNDAVRQETLDKLKEEIPNLDVLSMSQFNMSEPLDREECLNIVSQYSYGIGVGRALLEMLGMGLKCIVAGAEYGGPVLDTQTFNSHHLYNCNSTHKYSLGSIKQDIDALVSSDVVIDKNLFDMKKMAKFYLNLLEVPVCV